MIHGRIRMSDGSIVADPSAESLHGLLDEDGSLSWLDLESPTVEELGLLAGMLGWDHLTVEDVTKQGQRSKLERFPGYDLLVMHGLVYVQAPGAATARLSTPEIDFVFARNYVATIHYTELPFLQELRETPAHWARLLGTAADDILYQLTDRMVDSYFPVLDAMHDAVDELEDRIVSDPSDQLLPVIFDMKRDAVVMRKAISPQLEVFSRLTSPAYGVVSEERSTGFRDVHDHLIRVFESADSYRELMGGALDAYLSTVSNRMNEVMKRLTVMAALFLPITFFTGVFGMNLRETPIWNDFIFWLFLAGMFAVSAVQFWYFRKKKWV